MEVSSYEDGRSSPNQPERKEKSHYQEHAEAVTAAREEIKNLRSFLDNLFDNSMDEPRENFCYEHTGCLLFPKSLLVDGEQKDGTCEIVVKTLKQELSVSDFEQTTIAHAYLPARSKWCHIATNNSNTVLEKLASRGVVRCFHYKCPGHHIPFRVAEYVRIDGIPGSIVANAPTNSRVSRVKRLIAFDLEDFCANDQDKFHPTRFRIHNPRFIGGGSPEGTYSVGIVAPTLSVAQRLMYHFSGSYYDRVPVSAYMPNLERTEFCWSCRKHDHTYKYCDLRLNMYQLEGFTRAGLSHESFRLLGHKLGARLLLFKNSLSDLRTDKRIFDPSTPHSLGVDRKFVFFFERLEDVEFALRHKPFIVHLDPEFQPIVRHRNFSTENFGSGVSAVPIREQSSRKQSMSVPKPYRSPTDPVGKKKILDNIEKLKKHKDLDEKGGGGGGDDNVGGDVGPKDKDNGDTHNVAKQNNATDNEGSANVSVSGHQSDTQLEDTDAKMDQVPSGNTQTRAEPSTSDVEHGTSRAQVDDTNDDSGRTGDVAGHDHEAVDDSDRTEDVTGHEDVEMTDSHTVLPSESQSSLSGLDIDRDSSRVWSSVVGGSSIASRHTHVARSHRKRDNKTVGAKRKNRSSGNVSVRIKSLSTKFQSSSDLTRQGSGSSQAKKKRRTRQRLIRNSGSLAISSKGTLSLSGDNGSSQLDQSRPSGRDGEGGDSTLSTDLMEQESESASEHDTAERDQDGWVSGTGSASY